MIEEAYYYYFEEEITKGAQEEMSIPRGEAWDTAGCIARGNNDHTAES